MYNIGDAIVHPLHGAGTISGIESRKISGVETNFYLMKIPRGDMLVMIPVESCEAIGIRPVVCRETAEKVFASIPGIEVCEAQKWNKRYRDNMERVKSGDLLSVASVIKSLVRRDSERGLSTGERKMLQSAKQIFLSEISMSLDVSREEAEEKLYMAMGEQQGALA